MSRDSLLTSVLVLHLASPPIMAQPPGALPPGNVATITNGRLAVSLHLPNPTDGYYRGTRFDWSGVVSRLTWGGHEYFGEWFERHDPTRHDAITGPVEEFLTGETALGYDEAPVGGTFIRIGVGVLRKPDEPSFRRFGTYQIVDPGAWAVVTGVDRIEFSHQLDDGRGYGYRYRKTLRLVDDSMVVEHALANTGRQTIRTSVYNHNFFTLDGRATGPDLVVRFPFAPRADRSLKGLAEIRERTLSFLRPLEPAENVYAELHGFGATPADSGFEMENRATGAGVRVTGDRPLSRLVFWAAHRTACPEPYVDASVEPGETTSWRITYTFYRVER